MQPGQYTVRQALTLWLEIRSRSWTATATAKIFRHMAETWIRILGELPVEAVRPIHVQELYRARDDGRRSVAWINKERDTLHAFFGWCLGLELVEANPVTPAAWPRRHGPGKRVFVQISPSMLESIIDFSPPRYHRLFCFLYLTALRIGEAVRALWGWVVQDPRDPAAWLLRVPDKVRKQRTGYLVPLGPRVLEVLGPRGRDDARIFPEIPGKNAIWNMLHRVGRKLGIEHLSAHQFRRSCATNLVNSGMPLPAVQRYVGWAQAPRDWLKMFEDSYYLGIEGAEARRIQERLLPKKL